MTQEKPKQQATAAHRNNPINCVTGGGHGFRIYRTVIQPLLTSHPLEQQYPPIISQD